MNKYQKNVNKYYEQLVVMSMKLKFLQRVKIALRIVFKKKINIKKG